MAVSREPRFISGVWGPYYGAMIPGLWLNEGGQSATGSLIDLVIRNNGSYIDISRAAHIEGTDIYSFLNQKVEQMKRQRGLDPVRHFHVLPYFHGNRSPRADPYAKGMVSGLTLSATPEDVALLYHATVQGIAYGTRHIVETMNESGYAIRRIHLTGGHIKNRLFIQEHADITGCEIVLPKEPEAVLLGTAVLGAVASGEFSDIFRGMTSMCQAAKSISPNPSTAAFHQAKYDIFKEMYEFQKKIHDKMETQTN
jgi:ribulose kinase